MNEKALSVETAALPIPAQEESLGQAAALWLAGHSKRAACRETGVSRTTLSRYLDKHDWTETDHTRRISQLAFEAAEEAGLQLLERLGTDNLSAPQLGILFGISSDKLAKMQQLAVPRDAGAQLTELVRALHDRGASLDLKLEVKSPQVEREVVEVGSEQ